MSPKIILPPEWAKQDFIQLTFPHEGTDWAYMLDEVNVCFVEIARAILRFQNLLVVCHDKMKIKHLFKDAKGKNITFVELPTDDTWARDHGGITVFEGNQKIICDFAFNGWGKKYKADLDNQLTRLLFDKGVFGKNALYRNHLDFVLEGGSIESDGQGTLLTTSNCLLSANRNDLSKEATEAKLKAYFGLKRVLWLNHGHLQGDDTDSHIDTLARFCDADTIAYVQCTDASDEHYQELLLMEQELQNFKTLGGNTYKLVPLPMADAVYHEGERLPATYANFLIINGAVLVPTYDSPKDKTALEQLQKIFPDREIIGINCLPLIQQHGSLHCVTMQYY
ncbi:MAG: putative agmatine deiminase [Bacteroidetes bacterium ADurb.Bin174]|jgi:agmatine/peptidylarginine deiminase|nr:MAG: putative agmatine deiminase [Bacteroidetes bacterium ADurb.Bin174]